MADTATASAPSFLAALQALSDEDRKAVLQAEHPSFTDRAASWQVLLDAFEGSGGFLDGSYLWPFPREDDRSFNERKAQARYHNYLETLVDIYVRFVFTQGVKRTSESSAYNEWINDVDGAGTSMNEFLKQLVSVSLVAGHGGVLGDKTNDEPTGPTVADETARVVLSIFTATSIPDWRFDRNVISAVKLLETAPDGAITDIVENPDDNRQYLLWARDGWARFNAKGEVVGADDPQLDLVPFVVLRPKPAYRRKMIGRPIIPNANVVRALFNRASEEDHVLRDQAFSVLTVNVSENADLDQVRAALGNVTGTAKALIAKGEIRYETPSMEVPQAIRDNESYLVQEMYRGAHVRFRRDSLDSETAEAIRLQYTELNETLQGLARGLEMIERAIARIFFAWTAPTPEAAQAEFDRAKPQAQYPSEFFLDALITELQAWEQGIQMNLGDTMTKRIKKKAVRRIDPDIPPDELDIIDAEIDDQIEEGNPVPPMLPASDNGDVTALAQGGQPGGDGAQ